MEADSVLEKTKQVIQEDMKHKEMLDKLMKKYITRWGCLTISYVSLLCSGIAVKHM